MLPWWAWAGVWVVLVAGGALLVGLRVRSAWRSARRLGAEVSRAGAVLAALETGAERLRADTATSTAVTQDPHSLREEYERRRADEVADRAARQAARMPRWARVD